MIAQYVIFASICAGVGVIGWFLWDDMSTWFNAGYHQIAVCTGCTKGRFVPGCPVHDSDLRKVPK